jgi:hypothetical protein
VSKGDGLVGCGKEVNEATPTTAAGENVIPDGTYRRDDSLEALMKAGLDKAAAEEYVGVHTFTLADGVYLETPPSDATFPPCRGTYSSTATRLEVRFETNCSGKLSGTWVLDGKSLLLSDLRDLSAPDGKGGVDAIFGGRPFTKIK